VSDHVLVPPPTATTNAKPDRRLLLALAGVFALLCGAIIIFELFIAGGSYFEHELAERADQNQYHMPVIEHFAAHLPTPNLVSYPSATTPGYHLALAVVWKATGSMVFLRAINLLVGALLVWCVARTAARWTSPLAACALALPFALNSYTVGGTAWLTTDNAALLFVVLALGSAFKPVTHRSLLASGGWGVCAVLVRQVHLWIAGAPALVGVLASPLCILIPLIGSADNTAQKRSSNLLFGVFAFALPVLVVAGFALAWGGLVPAHEEMQAKHAQGWNPATFAYALALFGAYSVFFLPLVWDQIRTIRPTDPFLWLAAGSGLIISLAFDTSWERKVRDYGWMWRGLVKYTPDVMDRSIVITLLAVFASVSLVVFSRAACAAGKRREATILLVMFSGWVCAQSLNSMAWQRYCDPPILICLAWLGALAAPAPSRRAILAPALLGVLALAFTGASFLRDILAGNLAL
jgi:hypothetical protein